MLTLLKRLWPFGSQIEPQTGSRQGFGTFLGVFLPGILTMFGVIIFLRMGWIVGSAGLPKTLGILTLGSLITFVTALSIAASSTNREVKGGGTYYMISRSFGLEMGSAIGVPLLIAQLLSVPLCIIGFSESLAAFLPKVPHLWISLGTLAMLTILTFASVKVAMKAQLAIFFLLIASFFSLFLGGEIPSSTEAAFPAVEVPFWVIFAVFFPAATGIEASLAMSGDLRNPRHSLPIGTIATIVFAWCTYCAIAIFLWSHATPAALVSNPLIMREMAKVGHLINLGIWSATLSSALSCLLGSARTLQALAKDGVFPAFLSKESGRAREPRAATLVCAAITLVVIYYGTIDSILPILSMFLLIAYGMLNLATATEELIAHPSWRPTFRVHWAISLGGAIFCFIAMLMINSGACMLALVFVALIYIVMKRRNISSSWDDMRQAIYLFFSRVAIYHLSRSTLTMRSWRPHFLVFSETPTQLSNLMHITAAITHKKGFLTLASVFTGDHADVEKAERWKTSLQEYLKKNDIHALVEFGLGNNVLSGVRKFITSYGLGPLTPNTVVLGEASPEKDVLEDYTEIIRLSLEHRKNVLIVREQEVNSNRARSGEIDIWWDEQSKENSYFMILLSYMLQKHPQWKGTQIQLKSFVPTEAAQIQREEHFYQFLSGARLSHIVPKVYVAEESVAPMEMISRFSATSDLVFLGMRAPGVEESLEEYGSHYQELIQATSHFQTLIFAISAEHLELQELFN